MNMVTYSDPPTPMEIARAQARRRLRGLLGALTLLLIVLGAIRSAEAGQSSTHQPVQL